MEDSIYAYDLWRIVRNPDYLEPELEEGIARARFYERFADAGDLLALRDRAMLSMAGTRIGATVRMLVRDFDMSEHAALLLHDKSGKERRIACHHKARDYLRAYIAAAGFDPRAKPPLFQSAPGRSGKLSGRGMTTVKAWEAVRRRCEQAGRPPLFCSHSVRVTAVTLHHKSGGRLEDAQRLAAHADAHTTRLCIREERETAQAERVQLWACASAWVHFVGTIFSCALR